MGADLPEGKVSSMGGSTNSKLSALTCLEGWGQGYEAWVKAGQS